MEVMFIFKLLFFAWVIFGTIAIIKFIISDHGAVMNEYGIFVGTISTFVLVLIGPALIIYFYFKKKKVGKDTGKCNEKNSSQE